MIFLRTKWSNFMQNFHILCRIMTNVNNAKRANVNYCVLDNGIILGRPQRWPLLGTLASATTITRKEHERHNVYTCTFKYQPVPYYGPTLQTGSASVVLWSPLMTMWLCGAQILTPQVSNHEHCVQIMLMLELFFSVCPYVFLISLYMYYLRKLNKQLSNCQILLYAMF